MYNTSGTFKGQEMQFPRKMNACCKEIPVSCIYENDFEGALKIKMLSRMGNGDANKNRDCILNCHVIWSNK